MEPARVAIRAGQLVKGKWQVDARLGAGATATVYAATHKNNGLKVALKVLKPDIARDQEMRARFLREGYVANTIQHPGVVRVLDDDTAEDGSVFLVMELLTGEMLESRVAREGGKLPLNEVGSIIDRVLDVLAAAHACGVVHRDIKPENVFVLPDGSLKILDFGLAHIRRGQEETRTGLILGTPDFMSPEQAAGKSGEVDARSDLYSVGAMMFTLLTGKPVHKARSLPEHLVMISSTQARSLATEAPHLPRRLIAVVDRALELEKGLRWGSAKEMQSALRDALASHDSEPPDADTVISSPGLDLPPPSSQSSSRQGAAPVSVRGPMDARPRQPTYDELDETRLVNTGEHAVGTLHSPASGLHGAPPPSVQHHAPPSMQQPAMPTAPRGFQPAPSFAAAPPFAPAPPKSSPWPVRLLLLALVGITILLLALVPIVRRLGAHAAGGAATGSVGAPASS